MLLSGSIVAMSLGNARLEPKPGYTLTQASNNPGVEFTSLFRFRLVNDYWKLIASIPMAEVFSQLKLARALFTEYTNLVRRSNPDTTLTHQLTDIDKELYLLEKKSRTIRLIFTSGVNNTARERRGLFNSLGSAIKTVTGNMDHEDALWYENKLRQVTDGTSAIFDIAREQTSVVKTAIHTLNSSMETWESNKVKIQAAVAALVNETNAVSSRADQLDQVIQHMKLIQETYPSLMELIRYIREGMTLIIQAHEDVKLNRLNPLLITPDFLQTTLNDLPLPLGVTLPLELNDHTIIKYYELMKVSSFISGDRLNLVIRIPLVTNEQYTMFEVLPIPVQSKKYGNIFILINPEDEYIGVSDNDRHFLPYSDAQKRECKELKLNERICEIDGVIRDVHAASESCIMDLYKGSHELDEKKCEFRYISTKRPLWLKTPRTNTWVFMVPGTESGLIACRSGIQNFSEPQNIWVVGRGLLTLEAGCHYASDSVTLVARGEFTRVKETPFLLPRVDIHMPPKIYEILDRAKTAKLNLSLNLNSVKMNIYDLARVGHKVAEIQNLMDAVARNQLPEMMDMHRTVTLTALATLFLIVIVYVFRKPIYNLLREIIRGIPKLCCSPKNEESSYRAVPAQVVYNVTTGTLETQDVSESAPSSGETENNTTGRVLTRTLRKRADLC